MRRRYGKTLDLGRYCTDLRCCTIEEWEEQLGTLWFDFGFRIRYKGRIGTRQIDIYSNLHITSGDVTGGCFHS